MTKKRKPSKVLSKKELKHLLNLPTTLEEARTIKRKFEGVLAALEREEDDTIDERCPHCVYDDDGCMFRCGDCRYNKPPFVPDNQVPILRCTTVPFGGVMAINVETFVTLNCHSVEVHFPSLRRDGYPYFPDTLPEAKRWAKGHVEWADAVIRRKGVHLELCPK